VRFVIVLVFFAVSLSIGGSGCSKAQIRAYESHACSTNGDDDPLYVCSPAFDLVCINTYHVMVTNPQEAKKFDGGLRPVYVCRLACSTKTDCPQAGDVCCEGAIYGKDYGKKAGCAPAGLCESMRITEEDGGNMGTPPPDTGTAPSDAGADAARDAGAPDTAPDAPAGQ